MKRPLQLKSITFKVGPTPSSPSLKVLLSSVVLLVGPNNAGKSVTLREIESWSYGEETVRYLIQSVDIQKPRNASAAFRLVTPFKSDPPQGYGPPPSDGFYVRHFRIRSQQEAELRQFVVSQSEFATHYRNRDYNQLRRLLYSLYTVRLDGKGRFFLVDPKQRGNSSTERPNNHLWALFIDDKAQKKVSELTKEAFGHYFLIDPSDGASLRIRLSRTAPIREVREHALNEAAYAAYRQAPYITDFGDGVQSFVGLITAVMSLPHRLMLIDEPEAFLHPPLARRLGRNLMDITSSREGSTIVSTHSSDFLLGCLESSVRSVTVVRLTYERNVATARELSPQTLETIIKNPLIRSTGVLRALFHRGAIVTESDTDRAFYDEINRRLLVAQRGIEDVLFLNAQNWQTVPSIVAPLREIGIPAAGIVDLDMLMKGGSEFTKFLEAFQIPANRWNHLYAERSYFEGVFRALDRNKTTNTPVPVKYPGTGALDGSDKQRSLAFIDEFASFGLFLVPVGEVESWLKKRGIAGHATAWLIKMFTSIGQSESDPGYLKAGRVDVWKFLNDIDRWMSNPNRSGIR